MSNVIFRGMDGSNPLGFLAAMGAFRLVDLIWPTERIRLRWVRDGAWRPDVLGMPVGGEELCTVLHERAPWSPLEVFEELGANLTVRREVFGNVVRNAARGATTEDRRAAEFAAAFGCDVLDDKEKDRIGYTDLCFITGSGHQDFLGTARDLARKTSAEHLREALFGPWRYADPKLSMRWDPTDAREYALRWADPGPEGVYSVWGATRLAFEALPFFPVLPTGKRPRTAGFCMRNRAHEFTWPIWTNAVGADVARSLVALKELEPETPDRAVLSEMGIAEIFRAQRVRIGQGKNFKVSFRPARAV